VREGATQLQQQQQQHLHHQPSADSMTYTAASQSTHASHVPGAALHVAGQGQLSMASLKPRLPEDDEDSDDSSNVDRSVRLPARALLRPRHFTFAEADVLKSLKRAQERERERERRQAHEREVEQQRAHEAALHAAREQERERQRAMELAQHQREQTARDIAYKLSLQRQELDRQRRLEARAADHFSSSSTSEEASSGDNSASSSPSSSLRPGERAHSPRPPSHFRFDTHDIRKSYSKPSQRQAIGHWSTFPRSSTVMYATHQLKALIAHRQQEGEAKLQSAPASPHRMHMHDSHASLMHHHQASRHHHNHMDGTESSYTSLEDLNRRPSVPTASASSSVIQRTSVAAAAPVVASSLVPPVAAGNHHASSSNHSKHTLPASHLPPLESRPAVPAPTPAAAAFATPDRSAMAVRATRANHSRSITLGSLPFEKLRAHTIAFDKSMEWSSSSSAYQKQYPIHTHLPAHEQNSRIRRLERMGAHVRGASAGSTLERPSAAAAVRLRFSEMNAASGGGAAAGGALRHPVKAVPMHAPAQQLSNTGATADAHAARHQPNQNQHVSRHAPSSSSSYYTSNSAPSSPSSRQVARMTGARSRLQQHHHQVTSGSVRSGSAGSSGSPGSLLARRSIQYAGSGNESKSASANSSPAMPAQSRFAGTGAFSTRLLTGDFTLPLLTHDKPAPSASTSAAAADGWNANHSAQHRATSSYVQGSAYGVRH
jgi:hypothetical protein